MPDKAKAVSTTSQRIVQDKAMLPEKVITTFFARKGEIMMKIPFQDSRSGMNRRWTNYKNLQKVRLLQVYDIIDNCNELSESELTELSGLIEPLCVVVQKTDNKYWKSFWRWYGKLISFCEKYLIPGWMDKHSKAFPAELEASGSPPEGGDGVRKAPLGLSTRHRIPDPIVSFQTFLARGCICVWFLHPNQPC